jgi:hypothetical protein
VGTSEYSRVYWATDGYVSLWMCKSEMRYPLAFLDTDGYVSYGWVREKSVTL